MEKKHHFQGFRKFSIKTRLVIALLMISIIPLVGISGYSFHIFSAALQEKLSASISQTLSMINLNMVSEIEKYQYLCGSICISEEIKKGLLKKDMTDMEKNQAMLEIQNMIRNKIIYPAQAKNITVYDTDGNIFYDLVEKIQDDTYENGPWLTKSARFFNRNRHRSNSNICIVLFVKIQHNLIIHLINMVSG